MYGCIRGARSEERGERVPDQKGIEDVVDGDCSESPPPLGNTVLFEFDR
jgi:hypothetical protein